MIDCRRDYQGLRTAAGEMYIESFLRKELDEVLESCTREGAIEAIAKIIPRRTVAHGYYQWVSYLLWLRSVSALPGSGLELMADEAEGLLVVADAEREFRRDHPSCYKCGTLNEITAFSCRECMAQLKE
jgi:hypothetical protein